MSNVYTLMSEDVMVPLQLLMYARSLVGGKDEYQDYMAGMKLWMIIINKMLAFLACKIKTISEKMPSPMSKYIYFYFTHYISKIFVKYYFKLFPRVPEYISKVLSKMMVKYTLKYLFK